jgi:hypothetical protein
MLVVVTAAVIGTARGDDGAADPTAGFTPVQLTESRFVVEWPYNVPLDARYEFSSRTLPGAARTETKINVRRRTLVA